MLAHPPPLLRGIATSTRLGLDTLMIPPTRVNPLAPVTSVRSTCTRALNTIASRWVANNNAWIAAVNRARWDLQGA